MIDIELNGTEPEHVERIRPQFSVDINGKITWLPGLIDHDASAFYRGKTVTNEEFNQLFLRDVYQGNYITDSLSELFNTHLKTAIYRSFTTDFNLVPSYVKSFGLSDWGTLQSDGYYYITITAEEHGFEPDEEAEDIGRMNIDTEMYLLGTDGKFYEVTQVDTDPDNTVRIYTDDNTLSGFVVIRTNDKAYALASVEIDASQIKGLADVATSAKYTDLIDINAANGPNTRISANTSSIAAIISGDTAVAEATHATNADNASNLLSSGTIQNQPITAIFETGSIYVKNATRAKDVSDTINNKPITDIFENDGVTVKEATQAKYAQYADADTTKGTIEERLTNLGFREGSISLASEITATQNKLTRQGNYCLLTLRLDSSSTLSTSSTTTIGVIPEEFRPKEDITTSFIYGTAGLSYPSVDPAYMKCFAMFTLGYVVTIKTDGTITCLTNYTQSGMLSMGGAIGALLIQTGWEANPL